MTGFSEEVLRFRQSAEARLTRRLLVVVVGLVALIGLGLVTSEIWVGQHQQSIEVFTHTLNNAGRQRALANRCCSMPHISSAPPTRMHVLSR